MINIKIIKKIKKIINTGEINEKAILRKCENFEYVSFDLFDTMLKRNCSKPTKIFEVLEKEEKNLKGFAKKRIKAEKQAREKNKIGEITLADIYNEYDEIEESQKKQIIEKEKKLESKLIIENKPIINIYNKLIQQNKKIVFISDTYFEEEFIKEILSKNNIKKYEKIYISSKLNKTKRIGSIYKYVLEDLNIKSNEIVHIGDSIISDFLKPKKEKIYSIHIPKYIKNKSFCFNEKQIELNILNSYLKNTFEEKDYFSLFGYERFGPFLYGYVNWLLKSLELRNIKKVYFFSRDGLIMKKAFDIINNSDIESEYLEVSRRSLRIPILWMNLNLENIVQVLPKTTYISVSDFFSTIGLDISQYKNVLEENKIDLNYNFKKETALMDKTIINLYNLLKKDIIKNSKKEYKYLINYIKSKDIKGKFAVVDIGWSCGMQRFLEKTLDTLKISHEIYGYYIGIEDRYKENLKINPNMNIEGYLFDFKKNKIEIDKRQSFVGLLETLFLENDGSVKCYNTVNGVTKAIRYPYEYIENDIETFEYKKISELQEEALSFIQKFKNLNVNFENIPVDYLFSGIKIVGENPSNYEVNLFGDFRFFDDDKIMYLAKPKKLFYYAFNIQKFKSDFLDSRWKIGFLKRSFKIKLPYKKIYTFLRKFK